MNILTDQLPDAVDVSGQVCEVNTDFRTCLKIIMAFQDTELTAMEKQMILLQNLYREPPKDLERAITQGVKFLDGGEQAGKSDGEIEPQPMLYLFEKDARLIFAAFRQTHGIDLETAQLHWWKFLALFMDLGGETTFCQLVGLRKRVKTGKASKDELRVAREMGDVFEIPEPDTRTDEEKEREAEFMRLIEEGQRNADRTESTDI